MTGWWRGSGRGLPRLAEPDHDLVCMRMLAENYRMYRKWNGGIHVDTFVTLSAADGGLTGEFYAEVMIKDEGKIR